MARLEQGKRQENQNTLYCLLKRLRWGVRESEIAQELGWDRRTVNNYLRQLQQINKAYRDGRSWFAK